MMKSLCCNSKQKLLVALCLLFCLSGNAQQANTVNRAAAKEKTVGKRTLIGTVIDASTGDALIGVNVKVKGTGEGTITDLDGKFSIGVTSQTQLEISYIGYTTKEVPVGSQSVINVTLSEDSQALEEVVVVGYGTMEKKQVTSSVTSLSAGDMMKGVGGADITSSLQGKISGLILQNNGSANGTTTIQLRGLTSINSGKAPLIAVDEPRRYQIYRCAERCFRWCDLWYTCCFGCDLDHNEEWF